MDVVVGRGGDERRSAHDAGAEFAAGFDQLYRAAYLAARSVLELPGDAQECTREALARALVQWDRVARFAPAWTAHVALDLALAADRRHQRALPSIGRRPSVASADQGADAGADTYRRQLARALAKLPRSECHAVVLQDLVGLAPIDVARALGCTTGAVTSAAARGTERVQALLRPS